MVSHPYVYPVMCKMNMENNILKYIMALHIHDLNNVNLNERRTHAREKHCRCNPLLDSRVMPSISPVRLTLMLLKSNNKHEWPVILLSANRNTFPNYGRRHDPLAVDLKHEQGVLGQLMRAAAWTMER